jgi:hypothetical protein
MKIHYLSCHSILEYDEAKLLTELGHEVFSNGAYIDPAGHITLPRPGIKGMFYNHECAELARNSPKTNLPAGLIEPFDVLIFMHSPEAVVNNWDRIKHKRVILRTIGQNTATTERMLKRMRDEGLQIIRYSPKEANLDGYIGGDALIRFYKDPEEFKDWNGNIAGALNFSQSLKGRGGFCHYDEIMGSMVGFPNTLVYGNGNDDLGKMNGGEVTYDKMKELMQNMRVYVYGGTWPASYTLSFIEAFMTGIPVVAISKQLAHIRNYEQFNFYEVDEIIENGVDGFVCNDVSEMRERIQLLLNDHQLARSISQKAREKAITYFGKAHIAEQWDAFLKG